MSKYTGSALYVAWCPSTGGTHVLSGVSGLFKSFDDGHSVDKADVTAAANPYKEFLPTTRDRTFSAEFFHNGTAAPGGTATEAAMLPSTWGTLLWGNLGNGSGLPKGGALAFVEKYDTSHPFDDATMVSVSWQNSGTILFDHSTDTWS